MLMKIKKCIFIGAYIILLISELFFYVPYEEIEIFRSNQNVPHTEIVGSGYTKLSEIQNNKAWLAESKRTSSGKRVDTVQLVANLSVTSICAVLIYFVLIYPENKAKVLEANTLKEENELLRNYEMRLKNGLIELVNNLNNSYIEEIPPLDINALAFADDATQNSALKEYTDNITAYTARKIYEILKENEK